MTDAGTFLCTAYNKYGSDEIAYIVQVLGNTLSKDKYTVYLGVI